MRKNIFFLISLGLVAASNFCLTTTSRAAEIESYERKYITVYPEDYPQLSRPMLGVLQQELPRFSYYEVSDLNLSLSEFAREVYAYQQQHAGDLAAQKETPDLKFGEKVVTWQDTQKIIESAYVLVPHWEFGALELKNLHQRNNGSSWYVDLVSPLQLTLNIYQINQGQPVLYTQIEKEWDVSEEMSVLNMSSLLDGVKDSTAGLADPMNPLVQPLLLEAIKALPLYNDALNEDPASRMFPYAVKALEEASYADLIKTLKQQGAFSLKTQIENLDTDNDRLKVSLPTGETATSLGAWLDQGYQVIEYQLQNGVEKPVPIGYAKLREFGEQSLSLQPIIGQRDFELGDQLIEYPQTGIQFEILAGTASFGFESQAQSLFNPQVGLRLEYSLASLSGVSELYALGTGSAGLPLGVGGLTDRDRAGVNADALALPFSAEVGLIKRWYVRQWLLEAGLQGGLIGGALLNSGEEGTPTQLGFGATALLGTGWQFNPDFMIGLQGGWRVSVPTEWTVKNDSGTQRLDLPSILSNGPVLQIYANYMF